MRGWVRDWLVRHADAAAADAGRQVERALAADYADARAGVFRKIASHGGNTHVTRDAASFLAIQFEAMAQDLRTGLHVEGGI